MGLPGAQQLLANAMDVAGRGASQEGLVVVVPLKRDETITELPCWSFVSETQEKDAIFVGAVVSSGSGILFATLEGPYSPAPLEAFHRLVRPFGGLSVDAAAEPRDGADEARAARRHRTSQLDAGGRRPSAGRHDGIE